MAALDLCLQQLWETLWIPSGECLPVLVSYALGLAMVTFSPLAKLPQLLGIYKSQSIEGIVPTMFVMEVAVFSISWAYQANMDMAFREYGEAVILNSLTCVLVIMVWSFSPGGLRPVHGAYVVVYLAVISVSLSGHVPMAGLRLAYTWSVVLNIWGRVPQIMLNHKNGGTGQLSVITFGLNTVGSGIRVLTSLIVLSSGDPAQLFDNLFIFGNYALSAGMNAVILLQILMDMKSRKRKD